MKKVMSGLLLLTAVVFINLIFVDPTAGMREADFIGCVYKTSNLDSIAKLITASLYIAALALGIAAVIKFIAHRSHPKKTPLRTPIILLVIALVFALLPSIILRPVSMFDSALDAPPTQGLTRFGTSTEPNTSDHKSKQ